MRLLKPAFSIISLIILLFGLSCSSLWASEESHATEEEGHQEVIAKGPHGGRLFKDSSIALELLIFERAMPPHFRAFLYKNGAIISPEAVRLTVQLTRFNGKKEEITFSRIEDFLQSNQIIQEPHSFDVSIQLAFQGNQYQWHYSTYEGRVKIVAGILKSADIQVETAQSQTIKTQLKVVGKIVPNRDTLAPIYARYSGIIKSLTKSLGEEVTKGDVLATIESNESLQNYTITAPITGTIVQKYATNGELAQNTKPIYEVANLATVWADFTLYRKEAPLVKQGMEVIVTGDEGKPESKGTISYIAPLGIEDSQTTLARAVLSNTNRIWLPGMYVNGAVIIKEKTAPVAVLISAIQRLNDTDVVFVQQGDYFEATPVILGEKDDQWVEVVSGLDAGQCYVSKNSFFMKAELGKEGASHEH
ncbi:efflux RND transporter periplasmic adaptor subunit [Legionella pneumophila serogroup 1]|uniref:efflux RND transporter periplasmic adaptor subunit n=1 Tax=Legionella pneumophila TaxID=446 RepID=UPI000493F791|nr:efflux RND transporter periplasmic adaptor subunit [Legionella pneumophila]HAT8829870.1 HlyD family efflux transporter periplasmic adaptor subunit [Legionella pneumophila subsp. pneumophila]MCZ4678733.1 efflux RND transporter periplasmic adaptor subunit [Legionella pneumophila]MCZ4703519.1 efflux RND transporter periplasmic adaptor subunit [Legionella pneumophila]MCZ4738882.1 efflux RND transporter periplasmic adaptor subunit [Legionella pneumophila]MCZ4750506.1 efflux RND transporter perip